MIIMTSICANYLGKALALGRSVKRYHPDARFVICLVERASPDLSRFADAFTDVVLAKDMGIPNFDDFIFRHRIVEASTAVKGHLFRHMMDTHPEETKFVYVDPDCLLFSPMDELLASLEESEIVLTPHLLSPGNIDMEISCLKHGAFNLGFLGIRRSAQGRALVDWWADRLYSFCYEDFSRGLFTDQKWMNLAPCFFEPRILRHPGYNYGPWNLVERKLSWNGPAVVVDGRYPLRFVHFSGFNSGSFEHCIGNWADAPTAEVARKLVADYRQACAEFDAAGFSKMEWTYSRFQNGTRISDMDRIFYRKKQQGGGNPFVASTALKIKSMNWRLRTYIRRTLELN